MAGKDTRFLERWMQGDGCWMLDAGYWILDTRYRIQDTGYRMQDAGCWVFRLIEKLFSN